MHKDSSFHGKVTRTLIFVHDTNNVLCTTIWSKIFFSIVQKYEYDVKVSRTRTFVRGQRRTKERPSGRPLNECEQLWASRAAQALDARLTNHVVAPSVNSA